MKVSPENILSNQASPGESMETKGSSQAFQPSPESQDTVSKQMSDKEKRYIQLKMKAVALKVEQDLKQENIRQAQLKLLRMDTPEAEAAPKALPEATKEPSVIKSADAMGDGTTLVVSESVVQVVEERVKNEVVESEPMPEVPPVALAVESANEAPAVVSVDLALESKAESKEVVTDSAANEQPESAPVELPVQKDETVLESKDEDAEKERMLQEKLAIQKKNMDAFEERQRQERILKEQARLQEIKDREAAAFAKAEALKQKLLQESIAREKRLEQERLEAERVRLEKLEAQRKRMEQFERAQKEEQRRQDELKAAKLKEQEEQAFARAKAAKEKLLREEQERHEQEQRRLALLEQERKNKLAKQAAAMAEFEEKKRIAQMDPEEREAYFEEQKRIEEEKKRLEEEEARRKAEELRLIELEKQRIAEQERLERERIERERREAEEEAERLRLEEERRLEKERKKKERAEQMERERIESEKREAEEEAERLRLEEEKRIEKERKKKEKAERLERERIEREKREAEEEAERLRLEEEKRIEKELKKKEKAERLEREKAERLRLEEEKRIEKERKKQEKAEQIERERIEREQKEAEQEAERKRQAEAKRLAKEARKAAELEQEELNRKELAAKKALKEQELLRLQQQKEIEQEQARLQAVEFAERRKLEKELRIAQMEQEKAKEDQEAKIKREKMKELLAAAKSAEKHVSIDLSKVQVHPVDAMEDMDEEKEALPGSAQIIQRFSRSFSFHDSVVGQTPPSDPELVLRLQQRAKRLRKIESNHSIKLEEKISELEKEGVQLTFEQKTKMMQELAIAERKRIEMEQKKVEQGLSLEDISSVGFNEDEGMKANAEIFGELQTIDEQKQLPPQPIPAFEQPKLVDDQKVQLLKELETISTKIQDLETEKQSLLKEMNQSRAEHNGDIDPELSQYYIFVEGEIQRLARKRMSIDEKVMGMFINDSIVDVEQNVPLRSDSLSRKKSSPEEYDLFCCKCIIV